MTSKTINEKIAEKVADCSVCGHKVEWLSIITHKGKVYCNDCYNKKYKKENKKMNFKEYSEWLFTRWYFYLLTFVFFIHNKMTNYGYISQNYNYNPYNNFTNYMAHEIQTNLLVILGEIIIALIGSVIIITIFYYIIKYIKKHVIK